MGQRKVFSRKFGFCKSLSGAFFLICVGPVGIFFLHVVKYFRLLPTSQSRPQNPIPRPHHPRPRPRPKTGLFQNFFLSFFMPLFSFFCCCCRSHGLDRVVSSEAETSRPPSLLPPPTNGASLEGQKSNSRITPTNM